MSRFPIHRKVFAGLAAAAACAALLSAGSAQAQTWPTRPVTMIVPFPPGNVTDAMARLIGERLGTGLGQALIIENRPGASAGIGLAALQRATPDGYTIGMGAIGPMALNPALYSKLGYDPIGGVAVLSVVFKGPSLVLVEAGSPLRTMADLIKAAQARPDGIDYGTSGNGSSMHLTGELLARVTNTKLRHVPNGSSGAAATLLLGNHVPVLIDSSGAGQAFVRNGKMRALAVTSARRLRALPDVPTLAEAGIPNLVVDGWLAVVAPNGVPQPIRTRIVDEVRRITATTEVQDRMAAVAGEAFSATEAESVEFVRAEQKRWGDLIRAVGVKLD